MYNGNEKKMIPPNKCFFFVFPQRRKVSHAGRKHIKYFFFFIRYIYIYHFSFFSGEASILACMTEMVGKIHRFSDVRNKKEKKGSNVSIVNSATTGNGPWSNSLSHHHSQKFTLVLDFSNFFFLPCLREKIRDREKKYCCVWIFFCSSVELLCIEIFS